MSTRKVKDAQDLTTGELIYFKGHAQATYMSDGTTVEDAISDISSGSSDANVQTVDTGDVIDDVTVNYATKAYVDGLVGDINSVLESIINGGVNTQQENPISYGLPTRAAEYNYFYSLYPVESDITITANYYHPINGEQTLVCHISKGNTKIDETLTAAYEFTNVVITPESDSKYIYIYNS